MLIYLARFKIVLEDFVLHFGAWVTYIFRYFVRYKKSKIPVWDGHSYVQVLGVALFVDGFETGGGNVVHHRNRKQSDETPGSLVLMTKEHHNLVHLVEDHYDIEKKLPARPSKVDLGIYEDLPEYMKKKKVRQNWAGR